MNVDASRWFLVGYHEAGYALGSVACLKCGVVEGDVSEDVGGFLFRFAKNTYHLSTLSPLRVPKDLKNFLGQLTWVGAFGDENVVHGRHVTGSL